MVGAATTLAGCDRASVAGVASGSAAASGSVVAPISATRPSVSSAAPTPVDLVPVLTNPTGYPACGFFTWIEDFYGQRVLRISIAVAVEPTGTADEIELRWTVDDHEYIGTMFRAGKLTRGSQWRPPGTEIDYLVEDEGPIPGVGSPYLTQTTTITIVVDPTNDVAESNEANNILTLRVKPTKRQNIKITDNTCTAVP